MLIEIIVFVFFFNYEKTVKNPEAHWAVNKYIYLYYIQLRIFLTMGFKICNLSIYSLNVVSNSMTLNTQIYLITKGSRGRQIIFVTKL